MWPSLSTLLLSLNLLLYSSSALSTSKTPGGNFDLSHWRITLPDGSTKDPDDLEGGYTSQYFYTNSDDGAMEFYVPTSAPSSSRSELREQCNPDEGNDYNWDLNTGTHQMNGQYEIDPATTSTYFIIQQIHSKDGPGVPLLKIRYNDGNLRVEIKTDSSGNNEDKIDMGYVGKGNKFWLKIIVQNGYVKTYLNNDRKSYTKVKDYWGDFHQYFKTGCYKTQSGSKKAYVRIYSLTLYHSNDELCVDSGGSFTYDDQGNNVGTGIIVSIIAVSMVVILLCVVIGAYLVYKRRTNKKPMEIKEEVMDKEEEDDDDESHETQIIETNVGDNEQENEEEIEVDVEVEMDTIR